MQCFKMHALERVMFLCANTSVIMYAACCIANHKADFIFKGASTYLFKASLKIYPGPHSERTHMHILLEHKHF